MKVAAMVVVPMLLFASVFTHAAEPEELDKHKLEKYEKCIGFEISEAADYFILVKFVHRESGLEGFNAAERVSVCLAWGRSDVAIRASGYARSRTEKLPPEAKGATTFMGTVKGMYLSIYGDTLGGILILDLRTFSVFPLGADKNFPLLWQIRDFVFQDGGYSPADYDFYFTIVAPSMMRMTREGIDLRKISFTNLREWLIDDTVRRGLEAETAIVAD